MLTPIGGQFDSVDPSDPFKSSFFTVFSVSTPGSCSASSRLHPDIDSPQASALEGSAHSPTLTFSDPSRPLLL